MKIENDDEETRERIRLTQKQYQNDQKNPASEKTTTSEKTCPFSQKPCNPICMLYRPDKKDYECYFMELQSIAWFLRGRAKK
ncbi:MAG: hypothetical protein WC608_00085 [Parcubacteria group bacterium]